MKLLSLAALLALAWLPAGCGGSRSFPAAGRVDRQDPALDRLLAPDARIEVLADGFEWAEGPAWRRSGGYLVFSDVPRNTVYRWSEADGLSVFLRPSGYAAGPGAPGAELGSNGLAWDASDRLVLADHGNRMVARLDEDGWSKTPLATHFRGARLNSPNDVAVGAGGEIFFTDPPYGLEGLLQSPHKELDFSGVYRLDPSGELTLLDGSLRFPNGVALAPDGRTLYVANSDPEHAVVMAYPLGPGGAGQGRVLFDATPLVRRGLKGLPDGMAVDRAGNLFATGPGGVLVLTPDGRHLGTIDTGQATANAAFGDDGSTLYMTADGFLMRVRTRTRGAGF